MTMTRSPFKIKKVSTAEDHERALTRIDELMDAKPGSEFFDELEALTFLVEVYEDKEFPMELPSALAAIEFRMDQCRSDFLERV